MCPMKAQEPIIQTCTLQGLPEVLRQQGVDPNEFLARFELSPEVLSIRNRSISYWMYADVLREAALVCRTPHLGLLLSRAETHVLYSEGALGVFLKFCETVGETLEAIIRYYHAFSGGASYALRLDGGDAYFVREGLVPGLKHDPILQDLSLSDFVNVLRKTIGPDWSPTEVLLSHDKPDDPGPYEDMLKCPITFGADMQAIRFPGWNLDQEIRASDFVTEQLLRDLVSRSLAQPNFPFTDAVTQVIDILLPTGLCCVNSVSAVFDMHARTLYRRLKLERTTFADILDGRRKENAKAYLEGTSMPLAQISLALGYSAPEVFTRAFRKWYGESPNAWRKQRQEGALG
jgi:AraC-like DNA-binding protein